MRDWDGLDWGFCLFVVALVILMILMVLIKVDEIISTRDVWL